MSAGDAKEEEKKFEGGEATNDTGEFKWSYERMLGGPAQLKRTAKGRATKGCVCVTGRW